MADNSVPQLTAEERAAALEKAMQNRVKRAEIKQKLHDCKLTLPEVLDMKDDEAIARMKVYDLISSCPSYGETKTPQIMKDCGISLNRRIKGLGKRQESKLIEIFS